MEQKKFYQQSWFAWVMLFVFTPVGIFLMFKYKHHGIALRTISSVVFGIIFISVAATGTGDSETTETEDNNNNVEEVKSEEKDNIDKKENVEKKDVEEAKEETNKGDKNKELYVNEVETWEQEVLQSYDDKWKKYWQDAFTGYSDGEKTKADVVFNLETLKNDHYEPLLQTIDKFNIPKGFNKEQQEKIKSFKDNALVAVNKRLEAIDEMLYMIDNQDQLSPDKITSIVEEGDRAMLTGLASLVELKNNLGIEQ
ncbi:MerC domain-containing protein [Paraliobacillus ryukyuensis]|uniref:MerC domain-containing protein n=1 Tax=Paraliobacillus ryukyuensis TaxID=200904 RepID=UPI0009A6C0D4|nr:MerC domain-containing protein [Paraliobacillus ryukyuensis]